MWHLDLSSFATYYPSIMQKHRLTLALAGFWHVLKLAIGYYILTALLPPQISQTEKLMFLWFGSPALMAASFFFFPYFKPERYRACIDPAKLTIAFDAVVALVICIFAVVSIISGAAISQFNELQPIILSIGAIIVDCVILLLLSRSHPAVSQES